MINFLLTAHITLLAISLVLTGVSAGMAIVSRRVWASLTFFNIFATFIGLAAGVILLANHPITVKCLALVAYLISFVAVQIYVKRRNHALTFES